MEVNEIRRLTESIIGDLSDDKGLSKILPKLQILSFKLKNKKFSEWLNNEITGEYSSFRDLPEYRIAKGVVFANISNGMGIFKNVSISADQFSDSKVQELVQKILFFENISEIDNMARTDKPLKKFLPATALYFVNETLNPSWHTIEAWQAISPFACKSVVEGFKSKLLEFILRLDDELNIGVDYNKTISNDKIDRIMQTTINAGIVTTGFNSSITIENSNITGGSKNRVIISKNESEEIIKLIDSIEREITIFGESQVEVSDEISRIRTQLEKEKPRRSILKDSFGIIKEIFTETVATGTAPFIIEGIEKIIKLIS